MQQKPRAAWTQLCSLCPTPSSGRPSPRRSLAWELVSKVKSDKIASWASWVKFDHYIWSFQGRNQKRWAQATLRQWRQKHARILNILFCFVLLCLLLNLYFNYVKAELLGQLAVYVIQTKSDLVFLQILFCSQCYCSLCQITFFTTVTDKQFSLSEKSF